jgi:hypothetical protein
MRLSKSKVMLGLQCHRRLWWTMHERDAPELVPDPSLQMVFDRGSRVGEVATRGFPGGELVDMRALGGAHGAVERTRELLESGATTIFEASFRAHGVFAAIDILYQSDGVWILGEVKSTLSAKEQHIADAALQAWVARESGVDVGRIEIIHLNREHRFPDAGPLFVHTDVTDEAEAHIGEFRSEVGAQFEMLAGEIPTVEAGEHCTTPYECPFMARCWPARPKHHVAELYAIRASAVAELEDAGHSLIHEIPKDYPLTEIRGRQRRAIESGGVVVESRLGTELAALQGPFAYLDFETIAPAIPVWPGCRPYGGIAVQFSAHLRTTEDLEHHAWLAEGPEDPRAAIAQALLDATRGAETVLAYNAGFEKRCIKELAEAVPALAAELLALAQRLADLLPMVRRHVYHPEFGGSFSLKSVAPALLESGYDDLEIADGSLASATIEQLLLRPEELDGDPGDLRANLLAYCHRDTQVLVELHDELLRLASATSA